ncbi:hypothetical protein WJX72_002627 [[Myrmecia] bisecta]|uniref:Uncharacterized protein n=1 Tax=[Myrmecia] bisecta TaxID=41462 RepID=A0AAW1QPG2_9CHLO
MASYVQSAKEGIDNISDKTAETIRGTTGDRIADGVAAVGHGAASALDSVATTVGLNKNQEAGEKLESAADDAKDAAHQKTKEAKSTANDLSNKAGPAVEDAKAKASSTANDLSNKAGKAADNAKGTASDLSNQAGSKANELKHTAAAKGEEAKRSIQ